MHESVRDTHGTFWRRNLLPDDRLGFRLAQLGHPVQYIAPDPCLPLLRFVATRAKAVSERALVPEEKVLDGCAPQNKKKEDRGSIHRDVTDQIALNQYRRILDVVNALQSGEGTQSFPEEPSATSPRPNAAVKRRWPTGNRDGALQERPSRRLASLILANPQLLRRMAALIPFVSSCLLSRRIVSILRAQEVSHVETISRFSSS